MTAIATTDIFDMSEFCNMAFDGRKSLFTCPCQFFSSNFWISSNLFFNPYIKCITLSITLSIILSATLSATLSDILGDILRDIHGRRYDYFKCSQL